MMPEGWHEDDLSEQQHEEIKIEHFQSNKLAQKCLEILSCRLSEFCFFFCSSNKQHTKSRKKNLFGAQPNIATAVSEWK